VVALRLRLEGNTYEKIAKAIGYSYKRIYDFVQMALARRHDITDELAALLRKVQLERLGRIYEAHAPAVESVKSAMVMLKVLEREARLIGLDAPEPIVFPPVVPPDDYDFSRLSTEEQLALRDLRLSSVSHLQVSPQLRTTMYTPKDQS
jgi:hypothetical protein